MSLDGPPRKRRIVTVDDDPAVGRLVGVSFANEPDVEVVVCHTGEAGRGEIDRGALDLLLLDLHLPDLNGFELLDAAKRARPGLPVIMLTGSADVQTAVAAIQRGAFHFVTKPFALGELLALARRAIEHGDLVAEVADLRRRRARGSALDRLLGSSAGARAVVRRIEQVAPSGLTVLVQGETGVGKELVARAIHEESARRSGPLVAIDCGALPENLLESELFGHERGAFSGADRRREGLLLAAAGGTVFLDEIANMPLGLQSKLLRVLQERQVLPLGATAPVPLDVRFVAATNVPLDVAAREGRFRQDLFYRLAEFVLPVPPLRERHEDIIDLANVFREDASLELRRAVSALDPDATRLLRAHPWPGNVRELRNVIRQAVLLADDTVIRAEHLRPLLGPLAGSAPSATASSLREVAESAVAAAEKQAIAAALQACGGNKSRAARMLQVDYKTLHLKLKRYGLVAAASDEGG